MKILHSADWHLDSPLLAGDGLKQALLEVPKLVAEAARGCDLVLLSGDLFDGKPGPESLRAVREALESLSVPVVIAPGNHDYVKSDSPWLTEAWPEHVHIFTSPEMESIPFPALNCRVWGAAFTGPGMDAMLEGFRAEGPEQWQLGVLHGDPTVAASPYNPISARQIRESGLAYLALGHIHKAGQWRLGQTLYGWPGCPMGRGFDETEEKGVYLVTLEEQAQVEFLPLDTPRFHDWSCEVGQLDTLLPAVGNADHYRITLTGESEPPELGALAAQYGRFPNLQLRDRTVRPLDLWETAGSDTLEGVYFTMLREALEREDPGRVELAARISRQILEGQEVKLP